MKQALLNRANNQCELCKFKDDLLVYEVPFGDKSISDCILICEKCHIQLQDNTKIEQSHWHCLKDAMWSEENAVKVVVYQILKVLNKQDLLDMFYLKDDIKTWANKLNSDNNEKNKEDNKKENKKDANGNILNKGDTISILKELNVKGSHILAKRGTLVKNIKLSNLEGHIEGKINGTSIYIKCEFVKKI